MNRVSFCMTQFLKIQLKGRVEMEEVANLRHWDELIPDALGLIFRNLSLQEMLTVIPGVCKAWNKAVTGPYCWQEIDIIEWSKRCLPDHLYRLLRMLIVQSCGSLRELSASCLEDDNIFFFIAEHARSLQTLRLPRCGISDSIVEQVAGNFSTISFLDVSYCCKITCRGLEIIGKNCKLLSRLCRNMHPLDTSGKPLQDDEAHAIAATMPKLKHLEMAYHLISTGSVVNILSSCPKLEYLDLRGCWGVILKDELLKDEFPKLKVLGPRVPGYYDTYDGGDCSDVSDTSSEFWTWDFVAEEVEDYFDDESYDEMWDDEGRLEELELRFYEGIDENAGGYEWPPSP